MSLPPSTSGSTRCTRPALPPGCGRLRCGVAAGRPDLAPLFQNALPIVMAEAVDISNAVVHLGLRRIALRHRPGTQGRRRSDDPVSRRTRTARVRRGDDGRRAQRRRTGHPGTARLRVRRDLVAALSRRDRRFVTLACVAAADRRRSSRAHVTPRSTVATSPITEMREMVLHFAVYAGWPKSVAVQRVVDEQWAHPPRPRTVHLGGRSRCCR